MQYIKLKLELWSHPDLLMQYNAGLEDVGRDFLLGSEGSILVWQVLLCGSDPGRLPILISGNLLIGKGNVGLTPGGSPVVLVQEDRKSVPTKGDVLEGMKEEDAQDDGEEPADCAHSVVRRHPKPLLEKDCRAGHDRGGKEDIVYGRDNGGVEDIQGFVQVVYLQTDTDHQEHQQDPK